jgi:hypothetical protein
MDRLIGWTTACGVGSLGVPAKGDRGPAMCAGCPPDYTYDEPCRPLRTVTTVVLQTRIGISSWSELRRSGEAGSGCELSSWLSVERSATLLESWIGHKPERGDQHVDPKGGGREHKGHGQADSIRHDRDPSFEIASNGCAESGIVSVHRMKRSDENRTPAWHTSVRCYTGLRGGSMRRPRPARPWRRGPARARTAGGCWPTERSR